MDAQKNVPKNDQEEIFIYISKLRINKTHLKPARVNIISLTFAPSPPSETDVPKFLLDLTVLKSDYTMKMREQI